MGPVDTCGGVTLTLTDSGVIKDVCYAGRRLIESVYFAVRDEAWRTYDCRVGEWRADRSVGGDDFVIDCEFRSADGATLAGELIVEVRPDSIRCRARLHLQASVSVNRIGFCLLHPLSLIGADIETSAAPEGLTPNPHQQERLPSDVEPQMIDSTNAIYGAWGPAHEYSLTWLGVTATVRNFDQELELEDQRNWTDASFKAYPRSLQRPRPYPLKPGATWSETLEILFERSGTSRQDVESVSVTGKQRRSRGYGLHFVLCENDEDLAALDIVAPLVDGVRLAVVAGEIGIGADDLRRMESTARVCPQYSISLHATEATNWSMTAAQLSEFSPADVSVLPMGGLTNDDASEFTPPEMIKRAAGAMRGPVGAGTEFYPAQALRHGAAGLPSVHFGFSPFIHQRDVGSLWQSLSSYPGIVASIESRFPAATVCVDRLLDSDDIPTEWSIAALSAWRRAGASIVCLYSATEAARPERCEALGAYAISARGAHQSRGEGAS